jgi:para-nitrobenzyl esterase
MTLFLLIDTSLGELDGPGLTDRAVEMLGPRGAAAVARYTANRSAATSRDVLVAIASDGVFRIPSIRLAEAQVGQDRPTYSYLFTWPTPVLDGALRSTHALEIPFVFDNLDQPGAAFFTGDGPERGALATAMHEAWIAFARTGDPGWAAYDLDRRATRIFDAADNPVVDDPMGDERSLWEGIPLG